MSWGLFSRLRKAQRPPARALPEIRLKVSERPGRGSFVEPNPWFEVQAFDANEVVVGRVGFGVSPLFDRIYVDGLHVEPPSRGQGYACSLLLAVARTAVPGTSLPITALHEVGASRSFWGRLRAGEVPGLVVTQDLRVSEMDAEKQRWAQGLA